MFVLAAVEVHWVSKWLHDLWGPHTSPLWSTLSPSSPWYHCQPLPLFTPYPTWRPRNSFQWSSVTGQSNNSSSRIPLDCHNLGDLCCILVVLFSTICHQISQWLHVLNWTENSNLWFLILNLSLIFILLFVNYQNREFFLLIYRGKGAADNLIFIGHHPLHLKCAQYFFKVLEIVGLIDF